MSQRLRLFVLLALMVFPVLTKAQPVVNFGASIRSGCASLAVNFYDSTVTVPGVTGPIISRKWYFIKDSASIFTVVDSSNLVSPHKNLGAGVYCIMEQVTDSAGHVASKTDTDYIHVAASARVSFMTANPADTSWACPNRTVTFVNTSDTVVGCTATFIWILSGPNGVLNDTTRYLTDSFKYTFTTPGSYNLTLLETSCSGTCHGNIAKLSYIRIDSIPVDSFIASNRTPCSSPVNISFTNSSTGGATYLWMFGDGFTATDFSPTHTYTSSGNKTVTLVSYSANGVCPDTMRKTNYITVGTTVFRFINTADSFNFAVCQGTTITLKDITTMTGSKYYSWYDNATSITTSGTNPASFTYNTPGVYIITDSVYTASCYGSVTTRAITVNPAPTLSSFSTDTTYKCSLPLTTTFHSSVSSGTLPFSYLWRFGENNATSDTSSNPNPTHTYHVLPPGGYYNDTLIISDANGCKSSNYLNSYIYVGKPVLTISTGIDSGCTPLAFTYTTSITPINTTSVPYTIDSITFKNDATDLSHAVSGTDTLHTGAYLDTVRFYYHLPGYLGGCSFDTFIVIHVGNIHPDLSHVTIDTVVCPNTLVNFHSGCTNCTTPFLWNLRLPGMNRFFSVNDTAVAYSIPGNKYIIGVGNVNGCTDTLRLHDTVKVMPPASANMAISQPSCANPFQFKFTWTPVGGVPGSYTYYTWKFGDNSTDTNNNVIHNYPSLQASYTVTLLDSNGSTHCTNIDTVTLHAYPWVDSFFVHDTIVCKGKIDTFMGPVAPWLTAGGISAKYNKYVWHWGDGLRDSSMVTNFFSHKYTQVGSFADTLIIVNPYKCTDTIYYAKNNSNYPSQAVHVGGPSGSIAATPTIGCAPVTINLHDANSDFSPYFNITKRKWSYQGIGSTITSFYGFSTDTTLTFPEGQYAIYVNDTDNYGCGVKDTLSGNIISQKLHAYFYDTNANYIGCIGHQYVFHDTNSNCSYVWDFGDSSPLGSGQDGVHIYTATGTYTVKVYITSIPGGVFTPGCSDSMVRTNYVNIQNMNVGLSLNNDTASCPPLYVVGTNLSVPPAGGYKFRWVLYPNGAVIDSSNSPLDFLQTYIYSPGTISTITLIATNPIGCVDSARHTVSIGGPSGRVTISKHLGCAPLLADSLVYTNTSTAIINNVTWYFGDSTVNYDNTETVLHNYINPGTYLPYVVIESDLCGSVVIPDTARGHLSDTVVAYRHADTVNHPSKICFGNSVSLNVHGSGTGSNYTWYPAAGLSTNTGATVMANPTVTTTYMIVDSTLIGCLDTVTTTVLVDTQLSIHITRSVANDSICLGQLDTLTAMGSFGTYSWVSASLGLSSNTGSSVNASPSTSGMIYLTITDSIACTANDSFLLTVKAIPRLMSLNTDTVCDNILLTYIPLSSVIPARYNWIRASVFGISNGNAADTGTVNEYLHDTLTYGVNVVYTYNITAYGCTSTDTNVTVFVRPTPRLATMLTDNICSGSPYFYIDSSHTAGTTINWKRPYLAGITPDSLMGSGNINDTLYSSDTSVVTPFYAFNLNANGCIGMDTLRLNVKPVPVLSGSHTVATVCNDSLISYAPSSNFGSASFMWKRTVTAGINDTGVTSSGSISEQLMDTTHSDVNVTYVYTVSVNGCSSDTNNVYATVRPTLTLKGHHFDTTCNGGVFKYIPSTWTTDTINYTWTRASVTGITPLTASGVDSIDEALTNSLSTATGTKYMFIIDNHGCKNTDSLQVLVSFPANTPHISREFSDAVCKGTNYQNFYSDIAPSGGSVFTWTATNATVIDGSSKQYSLVSFTNSGTSVIKLTSTVSGVGCQSQLDSVSVNVGAGPADVMEVIYIENNFYCLRNDQDSYQWGYDSVSDLNGVEITGQTFQNYYNTTPDFAHFYYWVKTSHNGCTQKTYYNAPAVGVNTVYNIQSSDIKVYPNPAKDLVHVEVSVTAGSNVHLELYNLFGQKLMTTEVTNNNANFNIAGLPTGSYYIVCYQEGYKKAEALFIKN